MGAFQPISQAFAAAAALGMPITAFADPSDADCLFADPQQTRGSICSPDPLGLAHRAEIVATFSALDVPASAIELVGCRKGGFGIADRGDAATVRYQVFYPMLPDGEARDYIAPLVHEISHLWQMRRAGGMQALRQQVGGSSERIELGADFLTGVLFARHIGSTDLGAFQQSLSLLGSYRADDPRRYGAPENRVSAFRMGYFLKEQGDIAAAHARFQSEFYTNIHRFGFSG